MQRNFFIRLTIFGQQTLDIWHTDSSDKRISRAQCNNGFYIILPNGNNAFRWMCKDFYNLTARRIVIHDRNAPFLNGRRHFAAKKAARGNEANESNRS